MTYVEALELKVQIEKALPSSFQCSEVINMADYPCPERFEGTWETSWFHIETVSEPHVEVKAIHKPADWNLLCQFAVSFIYEQRDEKAHPTHLQEEEIVFLPDFSLDNV